MEAWDVSMEPPQYPDDIPLLSNRAMFFNKLENSGKGKRGSGFSSQSVVANAEAGD